jgi:hypothetical protein
MSRFWKKLVKIVPPFGGDEHEAASNIDSHNWRVIRLSDIYSEAGDDWPTVVACATCGVVADTEASKYPCGTAPKPVTLTEWRNRRR